MRHIKLITLLERCLVLWTAVILILSNSRTNTNIHTHHYVLGMTIQKTTSRLMIQHQQQQHKKFYRYFGFGSNVLPSTMKALRHIEVRPDSVTAALLPGYELKFYRDAAFVRRQQVKNKNGDNGSSDGSSSLAIAAVVVVVATAVAVGVVVVVGVFVVVAVIGGVGV